MRNKNLLIIIPILVLGIAAFFAVSQKIVNEPPGISAETVSVKTVQSQIAADGKITAANQATLHFQIGGKLVSLPFKEGDSVSQGQTIAQLDTYALQRQLAQALNSYQIAKDTNDQVTDDKGSGVLEAKTRQSLDTATKMAFSTKTEADVIYDAVKRIMNQNNATLDTANINVELAQYAFQLATLTSPLDGIVTHEDVSIPYVNITPTTSFTVADPSSAVFRAEVAENDIDYVTEGAAAIVTLNGSSRKIAGTVTKIFPTKVTLANGQQVYEVDIQSEDLKSSKLDQAGSVLIANTNTQRTMLIPAWTVLEGKYVWVENNGTQQLREIKTGKTHGSEIEVLSGLSQQDKVIVNPKVISEKKYRML